MGRRRGWGVLPGPLLAFPSHPHASLGLVPPVPRSSRVWVWEKYKHLGSRRAWVCGFPLRFCRFTGGQSLPIASGRAFSRLTLLLLEASPGSSSLFLLTPVCGTSPNSVQFGLHSSHSCEVPGSCPGPGRALPGMCGVRVCACRVNI